MVTAGGPVLWIIRRRRASRMVEPGGGPSLLDGCAWISAELWATDERCDKDVAWILSAAAGLILDVRALLPPPTPPVYTDHFLT